MNPSKKSKRSGIVIGESMSLFDMAYDRVSLGCLHAVTITYQARGHEHTLTAVPKGAGLMLLELTGRNMRLLTSTNGPVKQRKSKRKSKEKKRTNSA